LRGGGLVDRDGGRDAESMPRKVGKYGFGIVIEVAAVVGISLLALLLMFIVKAIMA
jgi:hypothetical protein